jgi:hypothetical protein
MNKAKREVVYLQRGRPAPAGIRPRTKRSPARETKIDNRETISDTTWRNGEATYKLFPPSSIIARSYSPDTPLSPILEFNNKIRQRGGLSASAMMYTRGNACKNGPERFFRISVFDLEAPIHYREMLSHALATRSIEKNDHH